MLAMQGTWVQSLVGDLRAHMPFGMAENRLLGSEIPISNHSTAPLLPPWSQSPLPLPPPMSGGVLVFMYIS